MKAGMRAGYTRVAVDDHFLLVKSGKTPGRAAARCLLRVKSGQTIAGQNPPLSAIVQKRTNFAAQRNDAMCQQPTSRLWLEIMEEATN
jgi:hypothetical protein